MNRLSRMLFGVLVLMMSGCGGDTGTNANASLNLTGTWRGTYNAPGQSHEGTIQFSHNLQTGAVTGTLTTSTALGRSATVSATVTGHPTRFTATMTFTDACTGQATATIDLSDTDRHMVGNYSATDCFGSYTGSFDLRKQ